MDIKKRLKNPLFIITLVALFLSSTHISPETLTSWVLLKEALLSVLKNPFLIGCFIVAVIGQFNDPTSKGLNDK